MLAGCSAGTGSDDSPSAGGSPAAAGTAGVEPSPSDSPTPIPTVTPGLGVACPVPQAERCLTLMVSGDLLVHPQLWDQAAVDAAAAGTPGLDFTPLLEGQRRYVEAADAAICHMETPVAEPGGPFAGYPMFNVPPQILDAAANVGFDGCTSASNHTVDAGTAGLERTLAVMDSLGLEHTGSYATEDQAGRPMLLETAAGTVGVVQATYGLNGLTAEYPWQVDMLDAADMIDRARTAREQGADVVVGSIHAGDEYASAPNAQQIETAHALADSGEFDFIYGHHTHSVLPIENYNGTWIVYGLGNSVTELSPVYDVNNEGLIVRVQFRQDSAGEWTVGDLAWAPSVIVRDPYRWCSVAADLPQGECAPAAQREAVRERTISVVESMGAADAGAREWLVTEYPGAPGRQ